MYVVGLKTAVQSHTLAKKLAIKPNYLILTGVDKFPYEFPAMLPPRPSMSICVPLEHVAYWYQTNEEPDGQLPGEASDNSQQRRPTRGLARTH
jgi:hypothetical protein